MSDGADKIARAHEVSQARFDEIDEAEIRARAEALNVAIIQANARGLYINVGIESYSSKEDRPPYTLVRITIVERPRRWREGGA